VAQEHGKLALTGDSLDGWYSSWFTFRVAVMQILVGAFP